MQLMRRPRCYIGLNMTDRISFTHERGCGDIIKSQRAQDFDGQKQDKQVGSVPQIMMCGSNSLPV